MWQEADRNHIYSIKICCIHLLLLHHAELLTNVTYNCMTLIWQLLSDTAHTTITVTHSVWCGVSASTDDMACICMQLIIIKAHTVSNQTESKVLMPAVARCQHGKSTDECEHYLVESNLLLQLFSIKQRWLIVFAQLTHYVRHVSCWIQQTAYGRHGITTIHCVIDGDYWCMHCNSNSDHHHDHVDNDDLISISTPFFYLSSCLFSCYF